MNRVYNVYLARNYAEMVRGPMTSVILCKDHAKRYKRLINEERKRGEGSSYVYKGNKSDEPCWWCEDADFAKEAEEIEKKF